MISDEYTVRPIPFSDTKEWILRKHYAHRLPSITYAFGLFKDGFMVGCCTYGRPFSTTLQLCLGKENQERLFELNRLVVNDGMERNVLSYFVSQTFKLLPKPIALVSYADSGQGHHGYIYQATNWLYTGMSAPFKDYVVRGMEDMHHTSIGDMVGRSDKIGHGKDKVQMLKDMFGEENVYQIERSRKFRYFMFLGNRREVKAFRKALIYPIEKKYPKGDNIRYDASYQPTLQLSLF